MPLGLVKWVSLRPRAEASWFIHSTYCSREAARATATCSAASLPLGNIMPCSNVSSVTLRPGSMPIVDEPSRAAMAMALTVTLMRLFRSGERSRATMVVAILVVLACGTSVYGNSLYSNWPELSSMMAMWTAVVLGAGASLTRRGVADRAASELDDGAVEVAIQGGTPLGWTALVSTHA